MQADEPQMNKRHTISHSDLEFGVSGADLDGITQLGHLHRALSDPPEYVNGKVRNNNKNNNDKSTHSSVALHSSQMSPRATSPRTPKSPLSASDILRMV